MKIIIIIISICLYNILSFIHWRHALIQPPFFLYHWNNFGHPHRRVPWRRCLTDKNNIFFLHFLPHQLLLLQYWHHCCLPMTTMPMLTTLALACCPLIVVFSTTSSLHMTVIEISSVVSPCLLWTLLCHSCHLFLSLIHIILFINLHADRVIIIIIIIIFSDLVLCWLSFTNTAIHTFHRRHPAWPSSRPLIPHHPLLLPPPDNAMAFSTPYKHMATSL